MPEENSNFSVRDLVGISKPADTLIKKIARAIEGVHKPNQIKLLAQAEAEAAITKAKADAEVAIIKANSDVQIRELQQRTLERFMNEETKKQKNIEDITNQAVTLLSENADAERMDDDWITNFFDKARIVSDKEMQELWSRVLAGEANIPGSFSKRTVNQLSDLDKKEAELFTKLCRFTTDISGNDYRPTPLIFDIKSEIYTNNGIRFDELLHLESIGLIKCEFKDGYLLLELPKKIRVVYHNQQIDLEMSKEENNELSIGDVLLTSVGEQLASICKITPLHGFAEYLLEKWKGHNPILTTYSTEGCQDDNNPQLAQK
ncbi:MAG: DUF2806 domain-containing protein [Nitrosomonas sp.]|uniref:DUF2806 domain-containing protein n=1 Tax=Nitrosomonas sp. TaxID=42353 RepID=UPI0032EF6E04